MKYVNIYSYPRLTSRKHWTTFRSIWASIERSSSFCRWIFRYRVNCDHFFTKPFVPTRNRIPPFVSFHFRQIIPTKEKSLLFLASSGAARLFLLPLCFLPRLVIQTLRGYFSVETVITDSKRTTLVRRRREGTRVAISRLFFVHPNRRCFRER